MSSVVKDVTVLHVDSKAANNVLEALWIVALQDTHLSVEEAANSEWDTLPEEEAITWVKDILSGDNRMVVHYLDNQNRYVPALRRA